MLFWGRSGGVDLRLGSFFKRWWKNKFLVLDSFIMVLFVESFIELSFIMSLDLEMVVRIWGMLVFVCSFEVINSNIWMVLIDRCSDL